MKLAAQVSPSFLAKLAVYAREQARMKDMPALLCALLSVRDPALCAAVFPRVIDDAKMLRTFVQLLRSGVVGRKSLGTRPKKLVQAFLDARSERALFTGSVGNDPSLKDVIKMVHPKPATAERRALYGYLLDKAHDAALLPAVVREFEAYKRAPTGAVPDVPFQMLTALALDKGAWTDIALRASWQTLRMNLSTFARHGVFEDEWVLLRLAAKLRDADEVAKARALPYQLLVAHRHAEGIPAVLRAALHDAMEAATAGVPSLTGSVVVCPDVSGSMSSPVTGMRAGATTAVRCIDVAGLVSASLLRKGSNVSVLPFDTAVREVDVSAGAPVLTSAQRLAAIGGGGTDLSAPLAELNRRRAHVDLVIYVSDNESWVQTSGGRGTATMREWLTLKARCPAAKLVCLDVQPSAHTQAPERDDVLNVGGFSDRVFEVIARFAAGAPAARWVEVIEAVELAA